jgi:hypothetical protein
LLADAFASEREALRAEDTSVLSRFGSFSGGAVAACRCASLFSRPGEISEVARNSGGIVFVRPDFLRPSMMKAVGVWVVALFHGGDSSSFLFLEDFLASLGVAAVVVVVAAVTGASTEESEESALDSGVGVVAVWPFSVTTPKERVRIQHLQQSISI